MLKETWQSSEKSKEIHMLSIREKLEKMKILADANLETDQQQQI